MKRHRKMKNKTKSAWESEGIANWNSVEARKDEGEKIIRHDERQVCGRAVGTKKSETKKKKMDTNQTDRVDDEGERAQNDRQTWLQSCGLKWRINSKWTWTAKQAQQWIVRKAKRYMFRTNKGREHNGKIKARFQSKTGLKWFAMKVQVNDRHDESTLETKDAPRKSPWTDVCKECDNIWNTVSAALLIDRAGRKVEETVQEKKSKRFRLKCKRQYQKQIGTLKWDEKKCV